MEWGQSTDIQFAKTSMFEALLYVFCAPFFNEFMKIRRRSNIGVLDTRGPRFLYVYGPSQNGKTTFFRYILKLLTGHYVRELSGTEFTMSKVRTVASFGTVFPLVFDDVTPSRSSSFEQVIKSYWDVWWTGEYVAPQIIMSSNTFSLKGWAKSRIKRVDFDVQFEETARNKTRLAKIISEDNPLYKWFCYLYLDGLKSLDMPGDDELELGRAVMRDLYKYAERNVPDVFPNEPVEKLYDPSRRDWQDILYRSKKATMQSERDRVTIEFKKDLSSQEVREYQTYLPQTVKCVRRGNTLIKRWSRLSEQRCPV